ncbi:hypothetical protein JXA02_04750 [candidate division KSB1 bacterium]|nr:hypothetical protein [candidate division KSB1 bacterium]RQW08636.1 MAG: hypothetical protein EH222_05445 [candidate division KSB1 bacterium]
MKVHYLFLLSMLAFSSLPADAKTVEKEERFLIKGKSLSIELDMDGGTLQVRPSHDEQVCFINITYPREKCDVDIRYNDQRGQLDIVVDNDEWDRKNKDRDDAPVVLLELPSGPALSLSAHIKAGETNFELGDLTLVDFELRHWAGETTLDFAEPNRTLLRTFDVNIKVGEVNLMHLGNALFEEADINSGIGELTIDFSGKGLDRSMARIDLDIGETSIILPQEIGAKIKVSKFLFLSEVNYPHWFDKRGDYYYSENYKESEKSLYLMISTGIGELGIEVN